MSSDLPGLIPVTTAAQTDIMYLVSDPDGGSEADNKITIANFMKLLQELGSDVKVEGFAFTDASGANILSFDQVVTAVNNLVMKNSATGNPVEIQVTGTDTNIDITLTPKGSGVVNIQAATESIAGTVIIADQDTTDTGTNDTKVITPLKLKTFVAANTLNQEQVTLTSQVFG